MRARYYAGCRCMPCTRVNARYVKEWKLRTGSGERPLKVSAAVARTHIARLVAAGMSKAQISRTTGVGDGVISSIANGTSRRIYTSTAERILALTVATPGPDDHRPIHGARRRIGALMAMGWSLSEQARRSGIPLATLEALMFRQERRWVHARTHWHLCLVYDRLSMRRGPSAHSRAAARRNGWPPPLAWNDEWLDDPRTAVLDLARQRVPYSARPSDQAAS